ncbi:MAG: hypothetical protein ACLGIW_21845 [Gammaproteobacteria bacterium]
MNRACPPCSGSCRQGRDCTARDPLTFRAARSLAEAFPGTSSAIEDADSRPIDREDRIVMWACIAVAAIVLVLGVL